MNERSEQQYRGTTENPGYGSARKDIDLERVREIVRRVTSRPLKDSRSPKEILDEAWGHRA